MTDVSIPTGVISIGQSAFSGCTSLKNVNIPIGVTFLGMSAFYDCASLKDVSIPNQVTYIGEYAFSGCCGLTGISIPSSVSYIGESAFSNCIELSSIKVDSSNSNFDSRGDCNAIIATPNNELIAGCKSTVIPSTVTVIGEYAFHGCTGLTNINIPNSVTKINNQAFWGCSGLTCLTIPASVTEIGSRVIAECSNIKSLIVATGNSKYDCRGNCNAVIETASNTLIVGCMSTIIPEDVTEIASRAFSFCTGLAQITLPKSIIKIGSESFWNCPALTKIIIPSSVTTIGYSSFSGCSALTDVAALATTPAKLLSSGIFSNKATIHVLPGCGEAYRSADYWRAYTIVEDANSSEYSGAIEPTEITLNYSAKSIYINKSLYLKASISPEYATDASVQWSTSNSSVATVSTKGKVTAVAKGTARIIATASNGLKDTCIVTVLQPVESITLSDTIATMWVNEKKTLTASVLPTTASKKTVKWTTSDATVATVSSTGVITAVGSGSCTITCTATDAQGAKKSCEVTVKQQVTSIALNYSTVTLWNGYSKKLTATVGPDNALNKSVIWTSSDTNVATVSSAGTVKSVGAGTCTITCTAKDGYGTKTTCDITVKQQVTTVAFEKPTMQITAGTSYNSVVSVLPANATNPALTWKSLDSKIAKVDANGVITAIKPGTVRITCTAADRKNMIDTCEVTVNPLKITDSKPSVPEATYGEEAIWYTRKLNAGKYASLCLPFDINLNDYSEDIDKVYVPMDLSLLKTTGTLMVLFEEVPCTGSIQAGQPFIVTGKQDASVIFKNVYASVISSDEEPETKNVEVYNFNGTTGFLTFNSDVTVQIGSTYSKLTDLDNTKYKNISTTGSLSSATYVYPYRSYIYFDKSGAAYVQEIRLSFESDEATAIENLMMDSNANEEIIYDLNGRRSDVKNGLLIKDGKVILQK